MASQNVSQLSISFICIRRHFFTHLNHFLYLLSPSVTDHCDDSDTISTSSSNNTNSSPYSCLLRRPTSHNTNNNSHQLHQHSPHPSPMVTPSHPRPLSTPSVPIHSSAPTRSRRGSVKNTNPSSGVGIGCVDRPHRYPADKVADSATTTTTSTSEHLTFLPDHLSASATAPTTPLGGGHTMLPASFLSSHKTSFGTGTSAAANSASTPTAHTHHQHNLGAKGLSADKINICCCRPTVCIKFVSNRHIPIYKFYERPKKIVRTSTQVAFVYWVCDKFHIYIPSVCIYRPNGNPFASLGRVISAQAHILATCSAICRDPLGRANTFHSPVSVRHTFCPHFNARYSFTGDLLTSAVYIVNRFNCAIQTHFIPTNRICTVLLVNTRDLSSLLPTYIYRICERPDHRFRADDVRRPLQARFRQRRVDITIIH